MEPPNKRHTGTMYEMSTDIVFAGREARLHEGRNLFENGPEDLKIVSLDVNCTGSHVSILCQQVRATVSSPTHPNSLCSPQVPSSPSSPSSSSAQVLLLWEVETDSVKVFVPSALSLSVHPSSSTSSSTSTSTLSPLSLVALPPELPEAVRQEQERLCRAIGRRAFCDHHWDVGDSRLLVLTASSQPDGSSGKQKRRSLGEVQRDPDLIL